LFVSTHNAARSQMAEGWARRFLPPGVRVVSAGLRPVAEVNPLAVRAMAEVGIDISARKPKHLTQVATEDVDLLVNRSEEKIRVVRRDLAIESWPMPDPSAVVGTEEDTLTEVRAIRDELRQRIEKLASRAFSHVNGDGGREIAQKM